MPKTFCQPGFGTFIRYLPALLIALSCLMLIPLQGEAQTPNHPLDGLTAPEYWRVYEALKASGQLEDSVRFSGILLQQPPKAEVLAWKPGESFRREALAILRQQKKTYEAVVNIRQQKVISWKEIPGVQAPRTEREADAVSDKVKEMPEIREALRRRGITDLDTVRCGGSPPGYFGTPEEEERRLVRVRCSDRRGSFNGNARPVEGLVVVWDVDEGKALRVIDTGAVPVPRAPADYDLESVGPLRDISTPIRVDQPLGPSFRIEGGEVTWQKWNFRFRIDPRSGLVVHSVRYSDGGRRRSILYEGSLSEIFVPYMDPDESWYTWTYIDAGEFANSHGGLATPLEPGTDCPANAVYFDAVYPNDRAIPERHARLACLFERSAGDFAWRHMSGDGIIESRPRRDLVLRMAATIGNYDYFFDWVFLQDGTIKVAAGATGLDQVKAVKSRTAAEDRDGQDAAYGRFIAENTVAVNHDHFFSFRLDLDVDGAQNSFLKDKLETKRLPPDHPRKSLWVITPEIAKTEAQAKSQMMMEHPAQWRIINPNVLGPLGYPVSFRIKPSHNAMTLLSPDDWPRRRAGFIDYHLWVTPQRDRERYAAGDYPTQSKPGDGLPAWAAQNRSIENTDLVVWYTMGMHHVPRAEDWPVMPTAWHEFELQPFDFFARNPALDLPKDR